MVKTLSPDIGAFTLAMMRRDDLDEARAALRRHSHLVTNSVDAAYLMHNAAQEGKTRFVALLHGAGVDVNIPMSAEMPDRPISSAAKRGMADTVRWLAEHGSDINYGWGGDLPSCVPLFYAIHNNSLDTVVPLVEAGADLLAKNRNNMTPLDLASGLGHAAIADYLRVNGGKLSRELPGYVAPPPPPPEPEEHPVVKYAGDVLGWARAVQWSPILPETVPVAVYCYGTETTRYLFTQGMSDRPMTVPPEGEAYRYAELVVRFDADWWPADDNDWSDDRSRWIMQWLRRVAQVPFETGTWLGGQWGVVSNGEPPEPLSAFTPMTCWLLLAERGPLTRLDLADGRSVVFYTMLPIHTAERDLVLKEGVVALLERFAAGGVGDGLEPGRPSVA